ALARAGAKVIAYERDADAVAALTAAARRSDLAPRIEAAARDLDRRPLAGPELAPLDGVVLDPPRPGAAAQAHALAGSRVPVVAYVSCNAGSFARDARTLVDGGYRLETVTPVDQFLWSPHVELVGVFKR
ncbi:MAG: class I SAM-dependent RNA methyltransferase, partial [Rhodospirillaceae bacterium]